MIFSRAIEASAFSAALTTFLIAVSIGVGGCAGSDDSFAGPGVIPADPIDPSAYPQVVPMQDIEDIFVMHSPPFSEKLESGLLKVRLTLRSVSGHDTVIRYRFIYRNSAGAVVDTDEWQAIRVSASSVVELSGQSAKLEAVEWRAEIDRDLKRNSLF